MVKIFIADDHVLFREGLVKIFELEKDFEIVGQAADGMAAVEGVIELEPDVVLMDINMPGITGVDATQRIREKLPEAKIVVLSIHDDESYIFETIRMGASGYLLKDVRGEVLIDAIRHVAAGGSFIHPQVTSKVLKEFIRLSDEGDKNELVIYSYVDTESDDFKKYEHMWNKVLTIREQEIIAHMAQGMSNRDMAEELFISEKTVKNHVSNIFQKMHVRDRTQAVLVAIKSGWVKI